MKERALYASLWETLAKTKSMIFLAGPRQVGKTTFAKIIGSRFANQTYFNWDLITHKKMLIENPLFFEQVERKNAEPPLVIFDEIHKFRRWKNYLKGVYDEFGRDYKFLVLGSGRLNVFQKGGDSLAGRYFLFTLWPFTLAELANNRIPFDDFVKNPLLFPDESKTSANIWKQLGQTSGFPEPFLASSERHYRLWSNTYQKQLIREDIRNLTAIKNMDETEILFSLLPSKVGSTLSLDSIARDMQISFNSVRRWIETFEDFFMVFRIAPWTKKIARAITKEKKLYFYDYAMITSEAAKFENMAALELWRAAANWTESGLGSFSLHYVRNKEKQEVDFLIKRDTAPFLLIETKLSDESPAPSLIKFQNQLNVPAVQLVNKTGICKIISNGNQKLLIISASRYLAGLP
ncbi:MAG: ATP-binding protein [Elusimicrobia bacterium]|nr:ATP-binding protein [Elusimicrobiota bacterium]